MSDGTSNMTCPKLDHHTYSAITRPPLMMAPSFQFLGPNVDFFLSYLAFSLLVVDFSFKHTFTQNNLYYFHCSHHVLIYHCPSLELLQILSKVFPASFLFFVSVVYHQQLQISQITLFLISLLCLKSIHGTSVQSTQNLVLTASGTSQSTSSATLSLSFSSSCHGFFDETRFAFLGSVPDCLECSSFKTCLFHPLLVPPLLSCSDATMMKSYLSALHQEAMNCLFGSYASPY